MKSAIVIPTIREESMKRFLHAWGDQFKDQLLIVVEDNPEPTFDLSFPGLRHYSWLDIYKDLGGDSWVIPRRTDCIRSYGFLKASQELVDMVVTLDDDCYPDSPNFLEDHYLKLNSPSLSDYWVSTGRGTRTRGTPYFNLQRDRECVINHGMWTNVPDFDAITQLTNGGNHTFQPTNQVIPIGSYFPMCGMNLAFKPQMIPAMYFLLMGQPEYPFDRFGDIWCGIIVKKICDHLGFSIKSGGPSVEHQKASDVWINLIKESPGYAVNETLWVDIDSIILTQSTVKGCYLEIASKISLTGWYWDRLREAMVIWTELF